MSKIRENIISNCEKNFLLKCLKENTRLDERSFDEFRDVTIEFSKDFGCCCVSLGQTKVLAQVSSEIQVPKSSRPSEGILNLNIELNPIAAPNFDSSSKSDLFTQLNRTLEKCIKDSRAVDLDSLCVKMNEKVWAIRVDINVLNHEGNILDCASIAALSALAHFRRPDISFDGDEITVHTFSEKDPIPLVILHYPVCVTYSIFERGEIILADPTLLEEGVADAFISVGMNSYRELCGLHLGGKAELTHDYILKITQKAASRAAVVVEQIKKALELEKQKISKNENRGFHISQNVETLDSLEDLENCFEQWKVVKSKRKVSKIEQNINVDEVVIVESKGANSAVVAPKDVEVIDVWGSSSEGEDAEVVEVPAKIQTVDLVDSDSEEERTIVLNADKITKKKLRKK